MGTGIATTSGAVGPMHAFVHPEREGRHTLTINFETDGHATATFRLSRPDLEMLRDLLMAGEDGGAGGEDFLFSLELLTTGRASLTVVRPAQLFALQFSIAELRELAHAIGEVLR